MRHTARKSANAFAGIVEAIADERVRYFYLMLGDALAQANTARNAPVNTSPAHVARIAAGLTGH